MIHYHGTPITPEIDGARILAGRHAMVSFAEPRQMELVAEACQSFALDNGAFSAWRGGQPVTCWEPYWRFVDEWSHHPGFDWALIPDVIDGSEEENDALLAECPMSERAVPVWHLHESLERLERLALSYGMVALGSSGDFAQIGTRRWWDRMTRAMETVCREDGYPKTKLHGLRMLDPRIFAQFPFAGADSTNVARNIGIDQAWRGAYQPATKAGRGIVLAERIEAFNSAAKFVGVPVQEGLFA
jgi:hypothetical protein